MLGLLVAARGRQMDEELRCELYCWQQGVEQLDEELCC